MKPFSCVFLSALIALPATSVLPTTEAKAHFGMVIPSSPIVTQEKRTIELSLSFSHPFEGVGMDLVQPARFYSVANDKEIDLDGCLEATSIMGRAGYRCNYTPARPGVYQFVMEPQPYWEPLEDSYIIHYTKTLVGVFGSDEGWQHLLGLPVEIKPLLRPFGNYQGNSFSGQVLFDGKPAPYATVEVEFYDQAGRYRPPTDYHTTQVITTDPNGVFTFTCPLSGWWGFSSLTEADYQLKDSQGNDKPVELGGVLWIRMDDYQQR
jgi:cobalt/nickel transport protein